MTGAPSQRDVIEFLSRPGTYGTAVAEVERIDTHGAVVFLAGARAYKLKRAVRFPYMDYSTPARRRAMCEAELTINRRTAPMLYESVVPVTRGRAGLALGGDGEALDWVVVMRRFDQSALFDRMAERGALTLEHMAALAAEIAAFHAQAGPRRDFGGAAGIAWVLDVNAAGLREAAEDIGHEDGARFDRLCREALSRAAPLLDKRCAAGLVRHCHGDLHLRNICLFDGRPVLFDAIEFNDRISCIDILYDFAFLLMDLERRDLRRHANAAFNRYFEEGADLDGLAALPLFLACRAGVKAQTVAAASRAQAAPAKRRAMIDEARACLALGSQFLAPAPARMVAIGGLSGTGKSTVARLTAPALGGAPGAAVLRSDVIRKRQAGLDATARLGPQAYTPAAAAAVYGEMIDMAGRAVRAGQSAVVDAVFALPHERDAVAAAARAAGVPFTGIWLEAPAGQLKARIAARRGDASDATVDVLQRQLEYDPGAIAWHRIDASDAPDAVAARLAALLDASRG
jgi:aminoglycoside phosphotransferase family enzyme/predicted kinase